MSLIGCGEGGKGWERERALSPSRGREGHEGMRLDGKEREGRERVGIRDGRGERRRV